MTGRSDIEGAELLVSRLALPLSAREYLALYEPLLEPVFAAVPAMPGAQDLVEALSARGVPVARHLAHRSGPQPGRSHAALFGALDGELNARAR